MTRAIGIALALAMLALPATAVAKPSKVDRKNAAQDCRAERGEIGVEAFRDKYGANKNKRNAFGRCVRQGAREKVAERRAERREAAGDCRTERAEIGVEAFREKYGSNRNKRNAFGKCVSQTVRAERRAELREERAERRNAAKECRAERDEIGVEAFREKYGTGPRKRNAFGKCVSAMVSADEEETETETAPEA